MCFFSLEHFAHPRFFDTRLAKLHLVDINGGYKEIQKACDCACGWIKSVIRGRSDNGSGPQW